VHKNGLFNDYSRKGVQNCIKIGVYFQIQVQYYSARLGAVAIFKLNSKWLIGKTGPIGQNALVKIAESIENTGKNRIISLSEK